MRNSSPNISSSAPAVVNISDLAGLEILENGASVVSIHNQANDDHRAQDLRELLSRIPVENGVAVEVGEVVGRTSKHLYGAFQSLVDRVPSGAPIAISVSNQEPLAESSFLQRLESVNFRPDERGVSICRSRDEALTIINSGEVNVDHHQTSKVYTEAQTAIEASALESRRQMERVERRDELMRASLPVLDDLFAVEESSSEVRAHFLHEDVSDEAAREFDLIDRLRSAAEGKDLVLDLTRVRHFGEEPLGQLLVLNKECEQEGRSLSLVVNDELYEKLSIKRLHQLFTIELQ